MSLTIEQTDAAILSTFHSMEEGVEYVLNDFWFSEMNRVRKNYGYPAFKDKKEYVFFRKKQKLFVNRKEVFDFKDKTNLAFALALAFAFAFAFIIQLALSQKFTNTVMFLEAVQQKMIMAMFGIHKLMVGNTISTKMKLMVMYYEI